MLWALVNLRALNTSAYSKDLTNTVFQRGSIVAPSSPSSLHYISGIHISSRYRVDETRQRTTHLDHLFKPSWLLEYQLTVIVLLSCVQDSGFVEEEGDALPLPPISIAHRLTFIAQIPHVRLVVRLLWIYRIHNNTQKQLEFELIRVQNVKVRNCRQNWLSGIQKCSAFGRTPIRSSVPNPLHLGFRPTRPPSPLPTISGSSRVEVDYKMAFRASQLASLRRSAVTKAAAAAAAACNTWRTAGCGDVRRSKRRWRGQEAAAEKLMRTSELSARRHQGRLEVCDFETNRAIIARKNVLPPHRNIGRVNSNAVAQRVQASECVSK